MEIEMYSIEGDRLTVTDSMRDCATLRPSRSASPFAVEIRDNVVLLTRTDLQALADHALALLEATKVPPIPMVLEMTSKFGRSFSLHAYGDGDFYLSPPGESGGIVMSPDNIRQISTFLTAHLGDQHV
jgi:hypothetical protein